MGRCSKEGLVQRAHDVLIAGAIGDALGMPTQMISKPELVETYGCVTDFVAPVDWHPVSRGLSAGAITDDTEQTLLLCDRILEAPDQFDEHGWAADLIEWEKEVQARGVHDLLGPSTKRALESLQSGMSPDLTGREGGTNGAAMRASPIGISTPIEPLQDFVDRVEETCRITHNTDVAISAAAAVAGAISAGLDGADVDDAIGLALASACEGARRGYTSNSERIEDRINFAMGLLRRGGACPDWDSVAETVGTSSLSEESVPLAFAILKASEGDVWNAAVISANLGGDTDTIGAIAASMVAAVNGISSVPPDKISAIRKVNQLDLSERAMGLVDIRLRREKHSARAI